jgi:hypothetical protein
VLQVLADPQQLRVVMRVRQFVQYGRVDPGEHVVGRRAADQHRDLVIELRQVPGGPGQRHAGLRHPRRLRAVRRRDARVLRPHAGQRERGEPEPGAGHDQAPQVLLGRALAALLGQEAA